MRQVEELKQRGVIEPSDSPWAANVVLVRKKDGTKRFCVDYRGLNAVTIKDAYPVPRIDETLDALSGAQWFSALDLASGYWQVALDEEASQKSTFVVRNGLYRWKCMPFGLCNAPATFERLMEKVMRGLQWDILLIYLDDVIVFCRTVTEEIERLRVVFSWLRQAGLKLKPSKCFLFQRSVGYLGHVVSPDGVATDPEKVWAVADWPKPKCVKYLYGRKVTVRTDHAALRWLLNFKNPEDQLARWLEVISEYDMTIQHRPGRKHGNADGLSRKACKQCGNDTDIGKVPEAHEVSDGTEVSVQPGVIEVPEKVIADSEFPEVLVRGILAEPHMPMETIREAQLSDLGISWIVRAKEESDSRPLWETVSDTSSVRNTLWSLWDQIEVRNNVLCRIWESDDGRSIRWRLVLPEWLREIVLQ